MSQSELTVGDRLPLTVGPPAHGGHCLARADGLVVFVRHALPGEEVIAEITEVRRGYLRADAVEIRTAHPDRVEPPCPYAHPGGCGGCDLQHAAVPAQLAWKASVVREQLRRLAGLSDFAVDALEFRVESLPGGPLGWRTRLRYAVEDGRAGLLAHRSHRLVPIDACRIADPKIQGLDLLDRDWPKVDAVEATASGAGPVTVRALRREQPRRTDRARRGPVRTTATRVQGPDLVREYAVGRDWWLPVGVFWQVHPAAADALVGAVRDLSGPVTGGHAWDLYGGVGLFAAALAESGAARVTLVESESDAATAARGNLSDLDSVDVVEAKVEAALRHDKLPTPVDLVVLDPPRSGAGAAVVEGIVAAGPRAVCYVACDPAAFARNVATFGKSGWSLTELRGFDCFPMTHHIELVGLLTPDR